MEKIQRSKELSQRLRELVEHRYPARGRFGLLEEASGIGANKWKNFFYKKQEATQELVYFWCNKYADEADWLKTGIESPDQKSYPFGNRVPQKLEGQTIVDRLNWVISEWAGSSGEGLFRYLSEKNSMISADEWAQVVLRTAQPNVEMIAVVANFRPHFTEWVIRGKVTTEFQVDPTDRDSVAKWVKKENRFWENLENLKQTSNDNKAE